MSEVERVHVESTRVGIDRRERTRRLALRGLGYSSAVTVGLAVLTILSNEAVPCMLGILCPFTILGSLALLVVSKLSVGPDAQRGVVDVVDGMIRVLRCPPTPGEGPAVVPLECIREFPLASITQGWIEAPDVVHLMTSSGEAVVVKVASAAEGDRLLRAAGVGAPSRVLRVPLASAASQLLGGTLFASLLLVLLGFANFFVAIFLAVGLKQMVDRSVRNNDLATFSVTTAIGALLFLAAYAVYAVLRRREAVIGTDGIAYARSLRTEFIPYDGLAQVVPDTRGARLERKDGRKVVLPLRSALEAPLSVGFVPASEATRPAEIQRRLLLDRIREAMAVRDPSDLSRVALDRLDRNDRPVAAWREDLQRLLTEAADYRGVRLSADDLGGVIEDPTAPAQRRVAAAIALAARDPGEARRRARIAAEASADEGLRHALEIAAEGEVDEALIEREAARTR